LTRFTLDAKIRMLMVIFWAMIQSTFLINSSPEYNKKPLVKKVHIIGKWFSI
jgi:hypothetical protein